MTMRGWNAGIVAIGVLAGCAHTTAPGHGQAQLSLAPDQVSVCVGDSLALQAMVDSQPLAPSMLTWISSNPGVAAVDQYGSVIAATAGTTWVVARENSQATTADSARVTVAVPPAVTVSFSSIVRSGTTQPVPLDSLTGAIDVSIATPTFGMCLNQRYDRAELMVGADTSALSVVAASTGGVLQGGSMNTLTFNTDSTAANGQPVFPNGPYAMRVLFVHHGAFGSDVNSSTASINIRN
jgi:Bacterial Ig-like domain (group 2)